MSTLAYREAHREELAEKQREYNAKNKARLAEKARERYFKNRDSILARCKAYAKDHPDVVLTSSMNRRAREKNATVVPFSNEQLANKINYWGRKCYLQLDCCIGKFQHVDHVIPLSRGGLHVLANLRPACGPCNHYKGSKMLEELV